MTVGTMSWIGTLVGRMLAAVRHDGGHELCMDCGRSLTTDAGVETHTQRDDVSLTFVRNCAGCGSLLSVESCHTLDFG